MSASLSFMRLTFLTLTDCFIFCDLVVFVFAAWTDWFISMLASLKQITRVHSSSDFVHGHDTAKLSLASGEVASIHAIVHDQVPALSKVYEPVWWLPFGDLQTIFSSAFHRRHVPRIQYDRKYIRVPDGGCISLDITPPLSAEVPAETPVVVVLHGLLGGSHASYVRSAVAHITRPVVQGGLGLRVVVFNLRGCSRTPVTSSLLYHPGMTDDVRSVVLYISSRYPNAKLFGLGFSLGAGYLTNYLAEEGEASPLTAGFVVSNVWDYAGCSLELSHGRLISRVLYNPVLGRGHQKVIRQNRNAFKSHPQLDELLDRRFVTMSWFTAQFMAHTAGVEPLQFLHDTSCTGSIAGVRVPLLCLNARDDPLLPERYLPVSQVRSSKHVVMVVTDRGGHLGWFAHGRDQPGELEVWYTPAIIEYFKAMLQVRECPRAAPQATTPDQTGMVHQVGRPNVGFKEVAAEHIYELTERRNASMKMVKAQEMVINASKFDFYPKTSKSSNTLLRGFLSMLRVVVFPL